MARPRIGVTSWHHRDSEERWEYVRDNYTRSVFRAGGLPIILPMPSGDGDVLDDYLRNLDGLLLTGGEDVHPEFYGEPVRRTCEEIDRERDVFELGLAKRTMDRGIPTFGICRGLQLINVACGGSLYQDLSECPSAVPSHRSPREERGKVRHGVRVLPDSRLREIVCAAQLKVTSTHHQIVNRLGDGLKATAFADDEVVEAVELPGHPFFLAVQWHPERLADTHPAHLALFQALVRAASHQR